MYQIIRMAAFAVVIPFAGSAYAAVSAEQAKELDGPVLTAFGAERAGNKEGTIPAYTGEAIKIPACYDSKEPGNYCDPWDDKPLFTITAENAAQYADKLTAGQSEMLKKYPEFKMHIYPTRRTMIYPKYVLDNTLKNATSCVGKENELLLENCYGGIPFPIPQTGNQVMWNHLLKYASFAYSGKTRSLFVDASGRVTVQGEHAMNADMPYYNPNISTVIPSSTPYYRVRLDMFAPARRSGEKLVVINSLDPIHAGNRVYQYLPGQRRVKLAPNIAYDTPSPVSGGGATMDQQNMFFGAMDRYDFKLIGKKDAFIPYNNFGISDYNKCPQEVFATKKIPNPECMRWELHRTWHVHATLKPGFRHVLPTRDFYFDEDSAGLGIADAYDAAGKIFRVDNSINFPYYDLGYGVLADTNVSLNLQTGTWAIESFSAIKGYGYHPIAEPKPEVFWSPDGMAGDGIR